MSINSKYYHEDIKQISKIELGIYTNDMVKKYSAVKTDPFGINVPDSYDTYEPKKGGLVDLRTGTCDIYLNCTTCGLNTNDCPGHFGHTELAEPVFHYGFLPQLIVVLKCICHKCSNILFERTETNMRRFTHKFGKASFKECKDMVKNINFCFHCGTPVPKIKKEVKETTASIKIVLEKEVGSTFNDEKTGIATESTKIIKEYLSARQCYNLLRNISDTDARLVGFNVNDSRPEDLVLIRFPIPPVIIRPTAKIDFMSASTMEDSLTLKIADIISNNIKVRNEMNKDSNTFYDSLTLLQYHIATYFDNDSASLPKSEFKSGGKPTNSISDRIKGKEGRMRLNILAKRVDFSARSVITSDPYIDIDMIGIPLKVAKDLTIPEEVTPHNIKHLTKLVQNGRSVYPGANNVVRNITINGKTINQRIDLRYRKDNIKLSFGDVVERHIVDGDYVLFNRQPTLHKPSMMGHRVHVLDRDDSNTFRMNVSVCKPYNADFDGDEMNIHLAQSIQARNELERIANVKYQIIGAKDSNPIIGCVQDALSGAYILSQDETIPYDVAANIICNTTSITKFNMKKGEPITGRQLFSYIIPEGINSVKGKTFQIKNGQLLVGLLDKNQLSTKKNAIHHFIWDKYGPTKTQQFINDTQKLILNYLINKGLTVGFNDTIIPDDMINQINELIHTKVLAINHMLTQFENDNDKISPEIGEKIITAEMNAVSSNIGKLLMDVIPNDNGFKIMIDSGSKGSVLNVSQIVGCIGQVAVDGAAIRKRVNGRTLSLFHQNDDTPEARGFVSSNFLNGLKGHEFFFHTMGGREGLIDTAIKSVTGDTPIIILDNNVTKRVMIGDWIDAYLDNNKEKVEHYTEREMELLKLSEKIYIPTSDYNGNVSWGEITAITRHDPGKELYEIKTNGGRQVIVTESKSLLIWNKEYKQFERMSTPDVKLGDMVPVTMTLGTPPNIINSIDVANYLPKTEYIYGTDFNIAASMLKKELSNSYHSPNGWWNNNNSKTFTLPYAHAHSLNRAMKREFSSNIQNGMVYPYSAIRLNINFQDKFELTRTNGVFIGLFLAEGNADIKSGYVQITNNDIIIQQFVQKWFSNMNIKSKYSTKINKLGGVTSDIRGYSTILAKFLTKLVGHGACNKFIPAELFNANEEFIIGLLDGYFSGDGTITSNSIQVTSASNQLIEGIQVLLNRLKIFGKLSITRIKKNNIGTVDMADINVLSIRGQWAKQFANKIQLIEPHKNLQLTMMKPSVVHRNFEQINDVVLDTIIEINKIDVAKYPKVYDLTVPSTLNFGLANGLHVVDTAESGYIQRKLVKSLEDMYINYEGMIRNSSGTLVEYMYGDSGIDQQRQTQVKLNLINMTNENIKTGFTFSSDELKELKSDFDNEKAYAQIIEMRDKLRDIYFKATGNYKIIEDSFMLPVNLLRITQEYTQDEDSTSTKQDLEPQYILDTIEALLNNYDDRLVTVMNKESILIKRDDNDFKFMYRVSLYEYLAPRKCIYDYKLTKDTLGKMIEDIRLGFNKALVEPGEMVGIIAAQSIGEPTSQMSITSQKNIKIIIYNLPSKTILHKSINIGKLCDEIIKNNPTLTHNTGHINSVETDLSCLENEYYIVGVDKFEQTHWNKISHISRHPVNGQLMTVTTKSGRMVTTTLSHSHLIRQNQTVEPIVGSDLVVGMRIPVAKHIKNTFINDKVIIGGKEYILDKLFGWFIGAYLAEGSILKSKISISNISDHFINTTTVFVQKLNADVTVRKYQGEYGPSTSTSFNHKELAQFMLDTMDTGSFQKRVPDFAFTAPNEFKAGLLQAYFDGDGNFQCDKTRCQIRVCSRSEQLITDISLLLGYFDIFGSIKMQLVKENPIYNLAMSARYGPLYQQHIGSSLHTDKLASIVEYANRSDAHNLSDDIDKINGLGDIIAKCGKVLQLEGHSRTYGRWPKKDSIGRRTLIKYISIFETDVNAHKITNELIILNQAANSNIIWDEILKIDIYTPDQSDYVYDFTVPSNQTFMVDNGIIVHNTLNTKHFAGVASKSSATMGVPRIKEILSYSKSIKTPQMIVYVDDKYSKSKSDTNLIASYFKHLTIGEMIQSAEILYTMNDKSSLSEMLHSDKVSNPFYINNSKDSIDSLPFVFRFKMDIEKMMDKETTLLDIKTKFITYWYKNFSNLKNVRKGLKDILVNVEKLAILSNNNNILHIRFKMTSFDYKSLTNFLTIVLETITLKGLDNITSMSINNERRITFNDIGETVVEKEYVVVTDGINIDGIVTLKGINHTRTKINDIATIYYRYGIEAARYVIMSELLYTFNAGGSGINHAHVALLVDMMTYRGEVISIDRHGLNKVDNDPISRASFENTMEHFINAALFSETDNLKSVSSRIALGKVIPGGTGAFDLLLDTNLLKNSEYIEDETGGRTNFIALEKEPLFDDIIKFGFSENDFFLPL